MNQWVNCVWFKLKPGSKHLGVCFDRYIPDAYVEGTRWNMGAYGGSSQWKSCANWAPRGLVIECEPTPTVDPEDKNVDDGVVAYPCERCGELTDEAPRMTIDGRNVALCKPCFSWAMDCVFRGVANNTETEVNDG